MKELQERRFEVKSIDHDGQTGELTIKGYASVFGTPDHAQDTYNPNSGRWVIASDIMEKGAFSKTLAERKEKVKVCLNHNIYNLVGKLVDAKEDDYGLFCEIKVSDAESELKTKIRERIYTDFSFGFQIVKADFEEKEDGTYYRHVREVKLYEISIVTFPRHEGAVITDVKSKQEAGQIIESLLAQETKEEKIYQLMQLKTLVAGKPGAPLTQAKPEEAGKLDFDKLKFLN